MYYLAYGYVFFFALSFIPSDLPWRLAAASAAGVCYGLLVERQSRKD